MTLEPYYAENGKKLKQKDRIDFPISFPFYVTDIAGMRPVPSDNYIRS
jgi:hypothetical protein